jgi:hypothetical protein
MIYNTIEKIVKNKMNYSKYRNVYLNNLNKIVFKMIEDLKEKLDNFDIQTLKFKDEEKEYCHHGITSSFNDDVKQLSLASELYLKLNSVGSDETLDLNKYSELEIDFENIFIMKE